MGNIMLSHERLSQLNITNIELRKAIVRYPEMITRKLKSKDMIRRALIIMNPYTRNVLYYS